MTFQLVLKYRFYRKAKSKNCFIMIAALDSFSAYLLPFLLYERCINTGEPAAVLVFPTKIKVVEESRPESTAAGSLGGWGIKVSKVSGVSKVGWNDDDWISGCMGEWGNGGMGNYGE